MSDVEYHNSVNRRGTYSPTDGKGFYVGGSWDNQSADGTYKITRPLDEHCEAVDMSEVKKAKRGPTLKIRPRKKGK